jgi:Zn-dependent protease with chaperone function
MSKLFVYSAATLGTLSLFVVMLISTIGFLIVEDVMYLPIFFIFSVGITIFMNIGLLLISPFIQDFIYRYAYKVKWYKPEEFAQAYPDIYNFSVAVVNHNKFKLPKFGVIADKNPQAFTYGSHRGNGRIVFTEGLLHFLNKDEVNSVIAHELGHIYNRDFIVMTMASTLLQIIYQCYLVFRRIKSRKNNPFPALALVAYVMYVVGTYLLLFLSRTREYLADRFAAEMTGRPDALATALFKIAYGLTQVGAEGGDQSLVESTRALGIVDVKSVSSTSNYLVNSHNTDLNNINFNYMFPFMVFDLKSPWAFVSELNSTHPLTAKRIDSLMKLVPNSNFAMQLQNYLASIRIDNTKLYGLFALDFVIKYSFFFMFILILPLIVLGISPAIVISLVGVSIIVNTLYAYPFMGAGNPTTVAELMKDVYASPVRGKLVTLNAEIIGRGQAGFVLGSDLMVKDNTGIIYVHIKTILGFITNWLFAINKFKKLLGQQGVVKAYFFRGVMGMTVLKNFNNQQHNVNSYPILWSMIFGSLLIVLGLVLTVMSMFIATI